MAAFYPLAYAAEQIAGGSVDVRNLTPAGAEPHDLELTPGDVRAVHDADARPLPRRRLHARPRDGGGGARAAARSICSRELRRRAGNGGGPPHDPHVWLDPVRYAAMVRLIGAALGDDAAAAPPRAQARRSSTREFRRGLAHCAAPADRDEPRRVRVSRRPLRPRAGSARGALAGGGAVGQGHRAPRRRRRRRPGATTVFFETLVSPKLARDGRAGGGRRDRGARTRSRG